MVTERMENSHRDFGSAGPKPGGGLESQTPLSGHPIAVAGRIGNYQELSVHTRLVANLMRFARCDVDTLTGAQYKFILTGFDRQSASQNVEELVRFLVIVANLRR